VANPSSNLEPFLQLVESKSGLCQRFTSIKRLGNGGGGGYFSLLFRAQDRDTNREVALKFLDPTVTDAYRLESFVREVEILGTLDGQPDILKPYSGMMEIVETFQHALGMLLKIPLKFYAAELAHSDVGAVLNGYSVDPADKLIQFRTMCRAVQRIHRLGIVHRDIKPSNFLIMSDGSLRLSDFGTARDFNKSKAILQTYSSPPGDWTYAPLEMISALHDSEPKIAFAGDMYALGAVLFEMFTGTPLNLHLFNAQMLIDLNGIMNRVLPQDRIREYNKAIGAISNKYGLPDVRDFGASVPRSIAPILNRMYGQLATIDYRQRAREFTSAFLQIEQCLVILKNQVAYSRWRQKQKAFHEALERKHLKLQVTMTNGAKS
jgi:serine/threonine protein kinase